MTNRRRFLGLLGGSAAYPAVHVAYARHARGAVSAPGTPLAFVTTSPLPGGSVGVAYSDTLQATGGTPPYTFSLVSDPGSTNTWTVTSPNLTGTPTTAETDTLNLKVTDSASASVTQPFSLTVTQPGALPNFTLTPTSAGVTPWTFGHAFKQGDVPSGHGVAANGTALQTDVRNIWPDGSAKYAVLSSITTLASGANALALTATTSTPPGSNVSEPLSLNVAATFTGTPAGTYNLNSAIGIDRSTWVRGSAGRVRQILGPVMSEFHYYVPTADDYVALWFFVRKYSTGAIEIETVVENGWLNLNTSGGPTRKDYGITLNVNGTAVYSSTLIGIDILFQAGSSNTSNTITFTGLDLRAPLVVGRQIYVNGDPTTTWTISAVSFASGNTTITVTGITLPTVTSATAVGHMSNERWSRVDWYTGGAPVTPQHDPTYLRATKVVPNYGFTSPTASAYTGFVSALNPVPFSLGNWSWNMGSEGEQDPIGLLPRWEALYCTAADSRAYAAMISNNRSSGRWAIHWRDETTGRVPNYLTYPTLAVPQGGWSPFFATPTGGTPGSWDTAHHPSNGYLPYIVEGRWTQMESLGFAAIFNILNSKQSRRSANGFGGVIMIGSPFSTRGLGWGWRTAGQIASCMPTSLAGASPPAADVAVRNAFVQSVHDSAAWHNQTYTSAGLNGPNYINSWGWLGQEDQDGETSFWWGTPWMVGFQGQALGHLQELNIEGLSNQNTDLAAMCTQIFINPIRAMGTNATWNYRFGAQYDEPYLTPYMVTSDPFTQIGSGTMSLMSTPAAFAGLLANYGLAGQSDAPGLSLFIHSTTTDLPPAGVTSTSDTGSGYWAQEMAPLAFAVDAGSPGAVYAWSLYTGSPSYHPDTCNPTASNSPQFALLPRTTQGPSGLPAWLSGAATFQWVTLPSPNTSPPPSTVQGPDAGARHNVVDTWSGACVRQRTAHYILHGGGHGDYFGNEIYGIKLSDASPVWTRLCDATPSQLVYTTGSVNGTNVISSVASSFMGAPFAVGALIFDTQGAFPGTGATVTAFDPVAGTITVNMNSAIGSAGSPVTISTLSSGVAVAYNIQGLPCSEHTYYCLQYNALEDKMMRAQSMQHTGIGSISGQMGAWSFQSATWDPVATHPNNPALAQPNCVGSNPVTGDIYSWGNGTRAKWVRGKSDLAGSWTTITTSEPHQANTTALAFDTRRQCFWVIGGGNSIAATVYKWDAATDATSAVSITDNAGICQFSGYPSSCYDPFNDCVWVHTGDGNLYKFDPVALTTSVQPMTGAAMGTNTSYGCTTGSNGRLQYVESLRGVAMTPAWNAPMFFARTA